MATDTPNKKQSDEKQREAENLEAQQIIEEVAGDEEEVAANQLAAEQELYIANKELEALSKRGGSFGHPSYTKYFVLGILAIGQDILDLSDFTGAGAVLAFVGSIVLSVLVIFISWLTNSKYKNAKKYVEEVVKSLPEIEARIAQATRFALRAARVARNVPGMKGVARQVPRTLVKIRRALRGNPLGKVILGHVIDLIPFVGILPWATLSVVLMYRDESKTLESARETSKEIMAP